MKNFVELNIKTTVYIGGWNYSYISTWSQRTSMHDAQTMLKRHYQFIILPWNSLKQTWISANTLAIVFNFFRETCEMKFMINAAVSVVQIWTKGKNQGWSDLQKTVHRFETEFTMVLTALWALTLSYWNRYLCVWFEVVSNWWLHAVSRRGHNIKRCWSFYLF